MNIVEAPISINNQNELANTEFVADKSISNEIITEDLSFKLGLWLSGLNSFLNLRNSSLVEESSSNYDWSKEFRLTHSVLLLCSKITLEFAQNIRKRENADFDIENFELIDEVSKLDITSEEIFELSFALKESVLLSEGLLRAAPLKFSEWVAWSNALADRLKNVEVVHKLIKIAEQEGERFLPKVLTELLDKKKIPTGWDADLRLVLPRFAKVLKWLSVVGKMLDDDEPLKNTLVLFARINEQMQEMMTFINNRLLRFPDENDVLFGSLDAAAYTASIELRKVYNQELKGLTDIRPTPLIYAKIETSYSLLNDSLQLTLVNFAQLIDPNIEAKAMFPNLLTKEQQSIKLRENMWNLLNQIKTAEANAEKYPFAELFENMNKFRKENIRYLFYKDLETVDRFIEEVLMTEKRDIVPLLHRFGAYLETLLGQINNRVVLADHPFEPLQKNPHEMFV